MQPDIACPQCGSQIPLDDVNVSTNLALCRRCSQSWSYSELLADKAVSNYNPQTPPAGAWRRDLQAGGFEIGATTRSAEAWFLIPFTCVWSAITLGGVYGTQIEGRHFSLYLSLFGIPFLIGAFFLISATLMALCGKVAVTVDGEEGFIFAGVGSIGRRRRFNWRNVTAIRQTEVITRGGTTRQITFDGEKQYNFGAGLKDERFNFMLGMLRKRWRETGHAARSMVGE